MLIISLSVNDSFEKGVSPVILRFRVASKRYSSYAPDKQYCTDDTGILVCVSEVVGGDADRLTIYRSILSYISL